MIRTMLGPRSSKELSIEERAEHIVALRAKLHAAEGEAATLAGGVDKVTGDYLLNEHGPAAAEVDKARASAAKSEASVRILRLAISRLEGEQAEARAAERQAAYEARIARVIAAHADVVNAAAGVHALILELAPAFRRVLEAETALSLALGSDERRDLTWPDAISVLGLTLWAQTDGKFPASHLRVASSPFVTGQTLQSLPDQWRSLGDRIRSVVRPPVQRKPDNQPAQEAAG
jgi:hypothetical protein